MRRSFSQSFFLFGAGGGELARVYSREPRKTMLAPTPSSVFHPFPNHHTLKQRLRALRVVSTRLVDTLETRWVGFHVSVRLCERERRKQRD